MATITSVDQDVLMEVILARVIEVIPEANERTAWIDDAALPYGKDAPERGENMFSVSPVDGSFDEAQLEGGNRCSGVVETGGFTVTHLQQWELDPSNELTGVIARSDRAMLKFKRKILSAILVDYLPNGSKVPWQPTGEDGMALTLGPPQPSSTITPRRHQTWNLLYQYIVFKCSWRWDL